jgi:hypothetical protein
MNPGLFRREIRTLEMQTEDPQLSANDGTGRAQCKSHFFVAVSYEGW